MINDEIKQLISTYVDGETTPEETIIVENLLIEDPYAQSYYREIIKLSKTIKQQPDQDLSADLKQFIHKQISGVVSDTKELPMKKSTFKFATVSSTVLIALVALTVSLNHYKQSNFTARVSNGADQLPVSSVDVKPQTVPQYEPYTQKAENIQTIQKPVVLAEIKKSIVQHDSEASTMKIAAGSTQDSDRSRQGRFKESTYQTTEPMFAATKSVVAKPMRGSISTGYALPSDYKGDLNQYSFQPPNPQQYNTEEYLTIEDNQFVVVVNQPLSTFSIDVDTGSYTNVRRFLNSNQMPPTDAVRIEEMINYFKYDYPQPTDGEAFSITTQAAIAPWNEAHQLFMIGLKGQTPKEIPPSNLVFLIDVSGSMSSANKLPLLKQAFVNMTNQLGDNETVSIVVYAGAAGEVLKPTKGSDKSTIINAINNLHAGGSTAGGQGIELAYKLAKDNFIKGGNNRVIVATDGDFNIGVSSTSEITRLIEEKRKENIFLTVLGFGMGNYKDGRLEQMANKGNGNYYYIDTINEANKVLVDELGSTLFTIAKDVKLQIEFNPSKVKAYRLIGYENRKLNKEDFNDDTKDAGELGAGHTVTALYEIIPAGSEEVVSNVDPLKYQTSSTVKSQDLMTVKLRYKKPDEDKSQLIEKVIAANEVAEGVSGDFAFVSSIAEFGMLLRNSEHRANSSYQDAMERAQKSKGDDKFGYRAELIELIKKASTLDHRTSEGIKFK